jgi:hypothetical protein
LPTNVARGGCRDDSKPLRWRARPQHLGTLGKVDKEWLAEARQAQQRLIHAQHEADVARAAFHRAVQRLVMHGAEPQDVAAALGISDRQLYELAHEAGDSTR